MRWMTIMACLSTMITADAVGAGESGATPSAVSRVPVNAVDPLSGRPVDRSVIGSFTIKGPATVTEHGPVYLSPETVTVAFADKGTLDAVRRFPEATQEVYINAAKQNRVVVDGRIVDPPAASKP